MEENKTMTIAECQIDTIKHIENVRKFIRMFTIISRFTEKATTLTAAGHSSSWFPIWK